MANTKADRTIPDLANATPTFLLDEIGKMRVHAARLKFLDGVYKQALQARLMPEQLASESRPEATPIIGDDFNGQYVWIKQERVDTEAVKEYFKDKPEELKKLIKIIEYAQLNTKPK